MNRGVYLIKAGQLDFKIAVLRGRHFSAERKEKKAWENLEDALFERDFLKARMERGREDEQA